MIDVPRKIHRMPSFDKVNNKQVSSYCSGRPHPLLSVDFHTDAYLKIQTFEVGRLNQLKAVKNY